ncbi:MAG: hypothetical protein RLZZ618_3630 [Pseudomonadota bacterium]|jgi:ATP-dependent Clp protease adapter protein ClpS
MSLAASLFDRLRDLLPARRFRPERWPPVHFGESPPLDNEFDAALYTLATPAVQAIYLQLGADAAALRRDVLAIGDNPAEPTRESFRVLAALAEAGREERQALGTLPNDPACDLHSALLVMGHRELRLTLSTATLRAGDFPFVLAHGATEVECRARWPDDALPCTHLEIVNDAHSPLDKVVNALVSAFGLTAAQATGIALSTHGSGLHRLALADGEQAGPRCRELNDRWRTDGLPLYCRPSPSA